MSSRRNKTRDLLASRDFDTLLRQCADDRGARRILQSFAFDKDELIRWRAIEAIGRVAGLQCQSDMEKVRDLVRRLFWLMTDESGGLGWHSPEIIGEILVNVPSLIAEFAKLLPVYLREEPFERGTHFAIYRVSLADSGPFASHIYRFQESLTDRDPAIRGLAALLLGVLGDDSCRESVAKLKDDTSEVILYDFDTGSLAKTTVGRMASAAAAQLGSPDHEANERRSVL